MTTITTHLGNQVDYCSPDPNEIDIVDIAVGLSRESRFAGHTRDFYSVAQHSVLVSYLVGPDDDLAFAALLHDAHEAYCKDIPTPLKELLTDFVQVTKRIDEAIRTALGVIASFDHPKVRAADHAAFLFEDAALRECTIPLIDYEPLDSCKAQELFLKRYEELYARINNQN